MNEKPYGIVYKATCLIDGKIYIGQTVQTLWRRRRAHENLSAKPSTYFHRALAKHGFDNFSWEVIETCSSKEALHEREQYWIDGHACMAPAGYNSAEGGKGGAYLESHKRRISEALKGRTVSDETRKKMSLLMLGRKPSEKLLAKLRAKTGESNHFFGKTHSEETRKRIGEKSKNRKWATGSRAGSWADVDRAVILDCYFRKFSNDQIKAAHREITGRPLGIKALMRVCRELGLHISEHRGKKALLERHAFIDAHSQDEFLGLLAQLSSASSACSQPAFPATQENPIGRLDSSL